MRLIGEMGNLLAESERFSYQPHLITAEIDLERISTERMRQNTFGQNVLLERDRLADVPHRRRPARAAARRATCC